MGGTGDETGLWYGIRSFRIGLATFYGIASPENASKIFTESKFPTFGSYPTLSKAKDACEAIERNRLKKIHIPAETPEIEAVQKIVEQIRDQITDAVEPLRPAIEKAVEKAAEEKPKKENWELDWEHISESVWESRQGGKLYQCFQKAHPAQNFRLVWESFEYDETGNNEIYKGTFRNIKDAQFNAIHGLPLPYPTIDNPAEKISTTTEPPPLEWSETTYGEKCVAKSREFEIIRESETSFTLKHRKHSEPKFIFIEGIKTATDAKKVAAMIEKYGNGVDQFEAANADGIPVIPDIKVSERSDETKPAEPASQEIPPRLMWSKVGPFIWVSSGMSQAYEINCVSEYAYDLYKFDNTNTRLLVARCKGLLEAQQKADANHAEYVKRQSEPASKYTTIEQTEASFPGFKNFIQGESAGAKMIIRFADGRKPKYITNADRFDVAFNTDAVFLYTGTEPNPVYAFKWSLIESISRISE